ncbi:MAG: outer membrane beta-barrel protein [Vicinamibacterales bacterium]
MRKILIAAAVTLACALPGEARADLLVTPYAGLNFGGSTVDHRAALGGSLTWLGSGRLGFELDLGFIPDFFQPKDLELDLLGTNNVTTLMGNLVVGRAGGGLHPYLTAGAGLLRSQVGSFGELFDTVHNGLGVNAGGGVRVGGRRLSMRGDVRYFRTLSDVTQPILEDVLGDFGFWRATAGLSIGF